MSDEQDTVRLKLRNAPGRSHIGVQVASGFVRVGEEGEFTPAEMALLTGQYEFGDEAEDGPDEQEEEQTVNEQRKTRQRPAAGGGTVAGAPTTGDDEQSEGGES